MPKLLTNPLAARTISHGPTPSTVFTASPIAPGGFHLARLDGAPLTTVDTKAQERSYTLTAALKDPTAELIFNAGAYLHAVTTRRATPPEHVRFHRTQCRVHVPGPRGGPGRWTTETTWFASTLTVTTTPFDYRTPISTAQHFQPAEPPSTTDPRHPDQIQAALTRTLREQALARAEAVEARRKARSWRKDRAKQIRQEAGSKA